jgi:hypothetical protein
LKGIKRIDGDNDGGPNIVPRLLHQSKLDSKLIFQIAKKLTIIKFVFAMNNKAECGKNLSKSVIFEVNKATNK